MNYIKVNPIFYNRDTLESYKNTFLGNRKYQKSTKIKTYFFLLLVVLFTGLSSFLTAAARLVFFAGGDSGLTGSSPLEVVNIRNCDKD